MRFIDLFAGLGGFHKSLHELGHTCVFASEIDPLLRDLYKQNWKIDIQGDIKKIVKDDINSIPEHDILCAGFPCQPFSKAGKQLGRKDENRGDLFEEIIKILAFRKPQYFILENVSFIAKHDEEATWNFMYNELRNLNYQVKKEIYSPQDFGIPQHRKRVFIVGALNGLDHFSFKKIDEQKNSFIDIEGFIEMNPKQYKEIPKANQECLKIWQELLDNIPKENKIPGFPIWSMEFGATYPYEANFPDMLSEKELSNFKGNFGCSLKNKDKSEQLENLPSYARVKEEFPFWKKNYIRQNRQFYLDNKNYIEKVAKKMSKIPFQSWQKLEWNVGENERKINNYILQFRASGIRVKKADYFPSLVCTTTQTPIIGWQNRYITKEEGLKLQSLEGLNLPANDNAAFKALGNAVNAKIIKLIAKQLLSETSL